MTISITFSRKMLAVSLLIISLVVVLFGGIQWVSAQGDGALLNVCIKDGKIRVVNDPNECDNNKEMSTSLVTGESFQTLEAENAALKALVRRLHRNSAAVIDIDRSGSTFPGTYTEIKYRLRVCTTEEEAEEGLCPDTSDVLEWTITEAEEGQTLTMSSGDGDFDALVNLLTNGTNDFLCSETEIGGIFTSCSLESRYFKDFVGPTTTDLVGYNIDQISLVADYVSIYHPTDGGTNYNFIGRLFYELAD